MAEGGSKPVISTTWEPKLPSFATGAKKASDKAKSLPAGSALYRPDAELIDGLYLPPNDPKKLNKLLRKQVKDTAGKNWFDMPSPTLTPEIKKDLQLLKLRSVIDPKRFYKKGVSQSKYFQVGTVVDSCTDYFDRLTKRERKATFADEILSDPTLGEYRKRKVRKIEEQNRPGGVDKWKIKGKQTWKRAKQRRH